jgi:hypothetical protein
MAAQALATVHAAAATALLVWILCPNWGYDRHASTPYVPKRSRTPSQFIQWLKSMAKRLLFDPIETTIYGLSVSRTRASRLKRRRERAYPLIYAFLLLVVIPFMPFRYARTRASPPAHLDRPPEQSCSDVSCFSASADEEPRDPMRFDFDSYTILIDNGASHSFTNCKADFVAPPEPYDRRVVGIKTAQATHIGTVRWSWASDDGQITTELIPNVLLCESMPCRLLSPQQWAQARQDFKPH